MAANPQRPTTEPGVTSLTPGSVHPLFARVCNNTSKHPPHNYYKRWHKRLLPSLPNPDAYPDIWDSPYRCPGVS